MALSCEKCQGAAVPAARTRTVECDGQTLRCLVLVSCCMVCGHQWEDDTYEIENARFEEEAREKIAKRQLPSRDPYLTMVPVVRSTATSQSQ